MSPAEATAVHTRLLKFALEVDESRAYWQHTTPGQPLTALAAFEGWCFGDRSLPRVQELLSTLRERFDAYPSALRALQRWQPVEPDTCALICHWHLQLSDPLYRAFTGDHLVARRQSPQATLTREAVVAWVSDQGPGRWTMATRIQFASKLLSAAHAAGLIASQRDPRPLRLPNVKDEALAYLLHLLREVQVEGSLLNNPYLASVGLTDDALDDRLRTLPGLHYRRQGALIELDWQHPSLEAWAAAQPQGTP